MAPQIVPDRCGHKRFYFSDGSLHLLVEDSLYCVHRSLFEIHANKFPVSEIDASFDDPYTLKDVKQIDFDRLLACLYPHTLLVEEAKTSEEWTSVWKLASKWGFESLQSRAIDKLKRTLNTPVDMVTFGRQYDIPDILLPGYATLCQINVPLTYEQGLQLGMKDVVDIYRIRHELHGFDTTFVSFEEATAKAEAFISNEGRKDDAEAGTAEQRDADLDADVGSVSSLRASLAEDDREPKAAVDNSSPPLAATTTAGVEKLGGSEHCSPTTPSASNPADTSGSQDGDSQSTLQDLPNMPGLANQGPELLDKLTMDNFDVVSVKILEWVNASSQTLHHVTQLIVEKAVNGHEQTDVCAHLCKEMVKKVSTKIRDTSTKKFAGGPLFREHLGEICRNKLEGVSITVALATSRLASLDGLPRATDQLEARRRRLIRFIKQLSDLTLTSQAIVKKWITTLLDVEHAEKLVTLSMLLDSAGPRWDTSKGKRKRMDSWFVQMTNIAQITNNARLRTLLQGVIERRNNGWVAEKRGVSCSSEDERTNEKPEVETVKTSKGGDKRNSKGDMMLTSSDEDNARVWFSGGQSAPSSFSTSSFLAPSAPFGALYPIGSAPISSPNAPRQIKKLPTRRGAKR